MEGGIRTFPPSLPRVFDDWVGDPFPPKPPMTPSTLSAFAVFAFSVRGGFEGLGDGLNSSISSADGLLVIVDCAEGEETTEYKEDEEEDGLSLCDAEGPGDKWWVVREKEVRGVGSS